MAPILELRSISKRFGDITPADGVSLTVERGEFFTFLGPSGSGKSTLLRIVAGLDSADSGDVFLDGKNVRDVPPWHRQLGMVFQQYANFPHMDVAANVAYGLRRRGGSPTEVEARVAELLHLVGLDGFEHRRVTSLSGGEQQRVAIARALAPSPVVLLLDEPLAALDEKIRREMQIELRAIQQATGTTFLYVTHDQEEAAAISDRIAVLNQGKLVQLDTPEQLFRNPRTRFVASFFRGCNILEIEAVDGRLSLAGQPLPAGLPYHSDSDPPAGGALAIRSETLRLDAPSADLQLPATLDAVSYRGLYHDYRLRLEDGQILSAIATHPYDVVVGASVTVGVDAGDLILLEQN
jgi:ABC-type Fe3+/spermidine/putrescine transport system ATPase subunit